MASKHIKNDYTIDYTNTANEEYSTTAVAYSTTTSTEQVVTTTNFSSQSMNSWNYQPEESNESQGMMGRSVAIVNSSKILVGVPHKNHAGYTLPPGDVGSVFEYTYTEGVTDINGSPWIERTELSGNLSLMNPNSGRMFFGTALAARDSYVAVGAPGQDSPGNTQQNHGAVYIFKSSSSGYAEEAMLTPQDALSHGYLFGGVLTFDKISNRLAVHGTGMNDVYIFNSGSSGWQRESIITASANLYDEYTQFGHSLALSGAYLAVGAPRDRPNNINNLNVGSVLVYKSSSVGWSEITYISSSTPLYNGLFGLSLEIMSNKRIIVGEPEGHPSNNKTGSVEIIGFDDLGNYTRLQIIENPRDSNYGAFGRNISAYDNGEFIAISRPLSNDNGTDIGNPEGHRAIFIYESSGTNNWILSGTLTRDQSLATYYANTPGAWFYGTSNAKSGFHVPLDVKDGVVLLGVEGASDSNYRRSSFYGYSFGEFRTWKTEVTTTTVTTKTTTTSTRPGGRIPFRFSTPGLYNIRGQSTEKHHKTFIGERKS